MHKLDNFLVLRTPALWLVQVHLHATMVMVVVVVLPGRCVEYGFREAARTTRTPKIKDSHGSIGQ